MCVGFYWIELCYIYFLGVHSLFPRVFSVLFDVGSRSDSTKDCRQCFFYTFFLVFSAVRIVKSTIKISFGEYESSIVRLKFLSAGLCYGVFFFRE